MNTTTEFGESLRAALRAADMTQADLANLAGVHPVHVCRLCTGRSRPSLAMAEKIAHALGVQLGDLTQNQVSIHKM